MLLARVSRGVLFPRECELSLLVDCGLPALAGGNLGTPAGRVEPRDGVNVVAVLLRNSLL